MQIIFAIVVLGFDFWALSNVWQSPGSSVSKFAWTIGIALLPIFGFVAWLIFGPKSSSRILA